MLCILYVNALGLLLGLAAMLGEAVLPARWPRRALWAAVIVLGLVLPGVYRAHRPLPIDGASHHAGAAGALFSESWWAHTESYNEIVGRGWAVGSSLLLLWGAGNVMLVAWVVRRARRRRGEGLGPAVMEGVPVLLTERIGPATAGLLRSQVLLPRWVLALPPDRRRYVVRHEEEHRRAHDTHLLFVCSLGLVLTPWNLALWWQLRRLYAAIEVDCDRRVVEALGNARAYGELLLDVTTAASRGLSLRPAFIGGRGMLERRIAALADLPSRRAGWTFAAALLAALLLTAALLAPHPVAGAPAHETHAGAQSTR